MAILNDAIMEIQEITEDLAKVIHFLNPVTDKQWDIYERLIQAHQLLRKADTDALIKKNEQNKPSMV